MSLPLSCLVLLALQGTPQAPRPVPGQLFDFAKEDAAQARFFASDPSLSIMPSGAEALDLTDPAFQAQPLRLGHTILGRSLGGGARHCFLLRIPGGARIKAELDNPHLQVKAFLAHPSQRRTDPGSRHPIQYGFRVTYENRRAEAVEIICEVVARQPHGQEAYTLTVTRDR